MNDSRVACQPYLIIVLLAFVLAVQIARLPVYSLEVDSSYLYRQAASFVSGGDFPLHGNVNSKRAYNPPQASWLYLLPMMITLDHRWVLTIPAMLLQIAAVLCLYALARRLCRDSFAVLPAALYALSPLGRYFGIASWSQALNAPLYVVLVYLLSKVVLDGKKAYMAVIIPILAWMIGMHWAGLLLIGVVFLTLLVFRCKLSIKHTVIGLAVAVLLWTPFLCFDFHRSYADIAILWKGPLPLPATHVETDQRVEMTLHNGEKLTPKSRHEHTSNPRWWTETQRRVKTTIRGALRGVRVNFHWSALRWRPGSAQERIYYHLSSATFIIGLAMLLHRTLFRRAATPAELFLLCAFILPVVLQNLTEHTSLHRADVAWIWFGPQVLIVAYGLSRLAAKTDGRHRVLVGCGCTLLLATTLAAMHERFPLTLAKRTNVQLEMIDWLADDIRASGRDEAVIAYDFLRYIPEWQWVADYHRVDSWYYIGMQHDTLLEVRHGILNSNRSADGMARDPEYIVVLAQGEDQYEARLDDFDVYRFGQYTVLRRAKNVRKGNG